MLRTVYNHFSAGNMNSQLRQSAYCGNSCDYSYHSPSTTAGRVAPRPPRSNKNESCIIIACSYMWWPGLDTYTETLAKACVPCQIVKKSPAVATLHHWPEKPWQRVHLDFASPFQGSMFLICGCSLQVARSASHGLYNSYENS